jgi:hypothetical protein
MKTTNAKSSPVPDPVVEVLKESKIGYLSVISKSQELYSYPVAFHYSGQKIYFMTPVSAAKFRIIKANPKVSFIVDNGKVTLDACGAMIQGNAKILTIGRTLMSILSVGPKIIGFTRKYPGMLTFYARGKELPDERKLYKYRLIRVDPSKIVYWQGYSFGRYIPTSKTEEESLKLAADETGLDVAAKLLLPLDGDVSTGQVPGAHDWLAELDQAGVMGALTEEERKILSIFSKSPSQVPGTGDVVGVTEEERRLLRKSKQS